MEKPIPEVGGSMYKAYNTNTKNRRAWCIRLPTALAGIKLDEPKIGGFQTVVQANDYQTAWCMAMMQDEWEILTFRVKEISIFPVSPI